MKKLLGKQFKNSTHSFAANLRPLKCKIPWPQIAVLKEKIGQISDMVLWHYIIHIKMGHGTLVRSDQMVSFQPFAVYLTNGNARHAQLHILTYCGFWSNRTLPYFPFSQFVCSFVRLSVTGVTYQLFSIFWRFIPWKPYIFWMHII